MAQSPVLDDQTELSPWGRLTKVFLGGLIVASAGFFLIAVVQTPGLDPPPQTAALFLVSLTAAVVSYLLLETGFQSLGFAATILTGVFVVGSVVLVVLGIYGPAGPETNPIGPVAWVLISLAATASAVVAWRG